MTYSNTLACTLLCKGACTPSGLRFSLNHCCCTGTSIVSAHHPDREAKGRGPSVYHELALVLLNETLNQTLTVDQADGLRQVVSIPVVKPTEVVALESSSDPLVAARNHVGAIHDGRIQDVAYKRVVVDGDDVEVQVTIRQCLPEVLEATIHLPSAWRQTCATVSCRARPICSVAQRTACR